MTLPDYCAVIPTYGRAEILPLTVRALAMQDPRPRRVVVIDATPNMADYSDTLRSEADGIELIHEPAEARSITAQRNQGVRHAAGGVVFLIDDDSLLYPGCAEAVLKAYAADEAGEVVGVSPALVPTPPPAFAEELGGIQQKRRGSAGWLSRLPLGGLRDFIRRQVVLLDNETSFIPYDGRYYRRPVPAALRGQNVRPTSLFHGARMTYRRSVFEHEAFETRMQAYAVFEDCDFSYRASRHGALLEALDGQLYHHTVASGRMPRRVVAKLTMLNLAALLRFQRSRAASAQWAMGVYTLRRLVAELIKDSLAGRWSLPQFRGVCEAMPAMRRILCCPREEASPTYARHIESSLAKL